MAREDCTALFQKGWIAWWSKKVAGPQKDDSDHAAITEAASTPDGEVDFKISKSILLGPMGQMIGFKDGGHKWIAVRIIEDWDAIYVCLLYPGMDKPLFFSFCKPN